MASFLGPLLIHSGLDIGTCSSQLPGPSTGSALGHSSLLCSTVGWTWKIKKEPGVWQIHTRVGWSGRCKPNITHKLSFHRQASVSREVITMEPKRCVGCVEPSKLQSPGEGKQGTGLISDSKAGRVDEEWVQHGARLLKFTAIHTWECPFPSSFAWYKRLVYTW